MVVGIAILLQQATPTTATHDWEIGLGTIGIAGVLMAMILLISIRRERPRLTVDRPAIEPVEYRVSGGTSASISAQTTTSTASVWPPRPSKQRVQKYFQEGYLHIHNNPKSRSGERYAKDVAITLRYLRSGDLLHEISARWSDNDQDAGYEVTQVPHQRTLAPNGVRHKIDIAAMFSDDDNLYAVDDSVRFHGWKKYPLGVGPVTVEVEARGSRVRTTSQWILGKDDSGTSMRLSPAKLPGPIGRFFLRVAKRIERKWITQESQLTAETTHSPGDPPGPHGGTGPQDPQGPRGLTGPNQSPDPQPAR